MSLIWKLKPHMDLIMATNNRHFRDNESFLRNSNLLSNFYFGLQKSIAISVSFPISSHIFQDSSFLKFLSSLTSIVCWQQIKLDTCQLDYYHLFSGSIFYFLSDPSVSQCRTQQLHRLQLQKVLLISVTKHVCSIQICYY